MAREKHIHLMFEINEGERAFVELKTENKTKDQLIDEAKQVLIDNGCYIECFVGFYSETEAKMMGLDTY